MNEDTRVSPKCEKINVLSGILKCGKCGGNMTRKKIVSGGKEFFYYVCSEHKNKKTCDSKAAVSVDKLETSVLEMLNINFSNFVKIREMLDSVSNLPFQSEELKQLEEKIKKCNEKKEYYQKHSLSLYEDLKNNVINEKDYKALKKMYAEEVEKLDRNIENINKEIFVISSNNRSRYSEYDNNERFESLSGNIAVRFFDKIFVYDKKRIEIDFKFQSDYDIMQKYINKALGNSASFNFMGKGAD